MTPDQHRRARDLFEAAVERDASTVLAWLMAEEPADAEVRAEVQSLLAHHSRAGDFLTRPVAEAVPHLLEDDHTLSPGAVVGTYTIIRELGRGGMGRVYLATDARLGRTVALKALAPQLISDPVHRDRLRREARAAAALTHPGICMVYALEEFDGEAFIASEFVNGHTLREEVAGARPSAGTIVATGRELAAALASAHEKGVVHRDLKPENVMRGEDGRIKVLDFGLARIEGDGGAATLLTAPPGVLAGTPAYMAPEQIEGRPISAATDVFAFGVLMYEWVCGSHPFKATSSLATMARIMDANQTSLVLQPGVPAFVAELIDRCLKKAPADRFRSATELLAAFEDPGPEVHYAGGTSTWWRVHQLTVIALYIVATARAWQIKQWLASPTALWAFVLLGITASIGGIVRGHLVFTDTMNRRRLVPELRRTRRALVCADLLMAATLIADALLLASFEPLAAVLTICVAVGIALALLLMEPATTVAVFGDV